jgi:UDPglucose 6-dehydrogenase
MDIAVVGTGYVGLVVGTCLSETGNHVVCADVDREKVDRLSRGEVPIHEPGLDRFLERNIDEGRLRFTTDVAGAAEGADVVFIAVGTPPDEDGSADLSHVLDVARTIAPAIGEGTVVINKSTVPVGTVRKVRAEIEPRTDVTFHVVSNPEFLKEGDAVEDFMYPDRVVCGVESDAARPVMEELYEPFVRTGNPLLFMDPESAELTKYAANAMLAARISFMNQLAGLCEAEGADVAAVRRGMGEDPRIGSSFLFAGTGYGGSCFPKDVRALIRMGDDAGVDLSIVREVHAFNEVQKKVLLRKVETRYGADLSGRRFAVWGLSFKPETDDMREAPAIDVVEGLLERGAEVAAHDPAAMERAREIFGDRIEYAADQYAACRGADGLLLVTEWLQYRRPDFDQLSAALSEQVVFDGRNIYEPARMRERGFAHYPIGRPGVDGGADAPSEGEAPLTEVRMTPEAREES